MRVAILLVMMTNAQAAGARTPIDLPPEWSVLWNGSNFCYTRSSNGTTIPIHPVITGMWCSTYMDWEEGTCPSAHWQPAAVSLIAAANWLHTHTDDFNWHQLQP